ncbi:efflux transporter outer membrane subunit [Desulfobacca acetoxidans]|uniref:RND efflux system, outer membrane lipoprotein, NodT family n=1 Tax=Desulfobacca acetoxidans (strain ATCC 700848 / DSM 11109 / ASRB2) TaxID=880072 RepID=F2NFT8_DESAR|nr:efflux transporter outer membrane subunit [Desulfobacca acetoxidans]AEB10207.1 RND efflux system, outer membrane lipoprotein, NodT family [Desulfobacca acetoxidans DSM 11109]
MRICLIMLLFMLVCGCTLGPDYQRPGYPVPPTFRGAGPDLSKQPAEVSFGDLKWFEVFKDQKLQELIHIALQENYDVQIAAQRVMAAREQVTIQRSYLFPTLNTNGQLESLRTSERGFSVLAPQQERMAGLIFGDLSWELDFFGRIRRATEAARAEFYASEENRKFVIQTLVTDLARAYIELRALDQQLDISNRTVKVREESLKLVKARFDYGWDSQTPVLMTENLVYGARAVVPDLQRAIEQQENRITTLLGRNPGPVSRGKPLLKQKLSVTIPPGMTSALLERRPDVRFAEESLVAANARIGEAKALLFPNIRITGVAGWESAALKSLFSAHASFWDVISPGITQPIFNAGRLRANVRATEALQQEALLNYKKSIQQAFREVSDALVGVRRLREVRLEAEKQVQALTKQTDLANQRYFGGVTPYLEVLDSDRQLFEAELRLTQVQANELLAVIALYRALGGGWQTASEPADSQNQ